VVKKLAIILIIAFVAGFALPFILSPLLPPSEAGFSSVAIAASVVLNLAGLAFALAWLPGKYCPALRARFPHLRTWLKTSLAGLAAHLGVWAAPVHHESFRVFVALAFLFAAQVAALSALHTAFALIFNENSRAPRLICALILSALASALFWTREPIQRLSKSGADGAQYGSYLADGVMKLSPPAAVAVTWHEASDAARASGNASSRRFDLVHGTLTYALWIGSYQAVPMPDILPSIGGGDFYARREFKSGVALTLLMWALWIMCGCDLLSRIGKSSDTSIAVVC